MLEWLVPGGQRLRWELNYRLKPARQTTTGQCLHCKTKTGISLHSEHAAA
jgi:hypothetical protein